MATRTITTPVAYNNNQWHQDRQSASYRKQTRKGGANALNIWLVDFAYLGIATFPWDYSRNPGIDGIRVNYASLPGGSHPMPVGPWAHSPPMSPGVC